MVLPENERVEDMREKDARGGRRRKAIRNHERREEREIVRLFSWIIITCIGKHCSFPRVIDHLK
jgi:hypothetical protein